MRNDGCTLYGSIVLVMLRRHPWFRLPLYLEIASTIVNPQPEELEELFTSQTRRGHIDHATYLAELALLVSDFLLLGIIERGRKRDGGEHVIPQWPPTVKFEGQIVKELSSPVDGVEHPNCDARRGNDSRLSS
jgi:hypothetical protein